MPDEDLTPEEQRRLTRATSQMLEEAEDKMFTFVNPKDAIMPIVSDSVMDSLKEGMATIKFAKVWKEWGFGSQNTVLLFTGEPGLGKTTAAFWIGKTLEKSVLPITLAEIGSDIPGQGERLIKEAFDAAERRKAIFFIDEADGLIMSRRKIDKDEIWRISVINAFLQSLEKYKGVVILATNNPDMLDYAMERRVTYNVKFEMPDEKARRRLWKALWPNWPLLFSQTEINKLAKSFHFSGATIETVIENTARRALTQGREPTWEDLFNVAQTNF